MKLNNKILYLTTAGVISTLTPANTNAQTFYQCMPITCSDGQYINGNKCENCPAGTFQKGNNRATSCQECSNYKINSTDVFGPTSYKYLSPYFARTKMKIETFPDESVGKYKGCDPETGKLEVALYTDCSRYSTKDEFDKKVADIQGCRGICDNIVVSYDDIAGGGCFICTGGCARSIYIQSN